MGRTSKFTFPVPGKKPKNNLPPIISPPMSKVQKILGNAEINIESPRSWDTLSASGISVSVSDHGSTASSHHGGQDRHFSGNGNGNRNGNAYDNANGASTWEVESETVPMHLHPSTAAAATNTRHSRMVFPGEGGSMHDAMSDTSSVSRARSNSTLKSWYDKSRVPLSVSQQTSSSAIAKGVPAKASQLLDVDGTGFNAPRPSNPANTTTTTSNKKTKRPSRLDFASFISSHLHHRDSLADDRSAQPSPSPSPSPNQVSSPNSLPSPDHRRSLRRLVRKPTRERLAELPGDDQNYDYRDSQNRPRTGATQMHGILNATAHSANSPQDLYNHYEEAAFRQVAELPAYDAPPTIREEDDDSAWTTHDTSLARAHVHAKSPTDSSGSRPLRSPSHPNRDIHRFPTTHGTNNTHANPVIREPQPKHQAQTQTQTQTQPHHDDRRDSKISYPGTSTQSASAAGSILSRSRQHKGNGAWDNDYASSLTSVSSRHTKTSRASKHTSQSLPDSERQERSVLSLSSDSEGDEEVEVEPDSPAETASKLARSISSIGQSSRDLSGGDKKSKRASFATTNTYLTIPSNNNTTITSNNGNPNANSPSPPRTTPTTTTKPTAYHNGRRQTYSPPRPGPRSSSRMSAAASTIIKSTATTPPEADAQEPLSPTSMHFYYVRSEPVVTSESNEGASSSSSSIRDSNPRFMAVTRQEQMLLAALRTKRAMMRENNNSPPDAVAELEGPLPEGTAYGHSHTSSQATIRGPAAGDEKPFLHQSQARPLRHQGSGTSTGTVKFEPRTSTTATPTPTPPPSSSTVTKPKKRDSARSSSRLSNRSAETISPKTKPASTRPSPGLGDFGFDHVDEEDEADDSDGFSHKRRDRVAMATQTTDNPRQGKTGPTTQETRRGSSSSGKPRTSLPPPGPPPAVLPDPPPRAAPREKRVVARESRTRKGHGVPRPDSPISAAAWPVPPVSTPACRAVSVGGRLTPADTARRKAVRLSAVGGPGPEVGWWGDDG
ncbi:hypothetical protein SODALDRAFT_46985 [Sodiomyces alkalinus F11]|uniref:Uncharacterized protein n=1 Tax=Sodiomyces alkalinus (strain CBS 110278 / VKM F-3762 / F11) TaxID=1314773 RepID=A0A3N2QAI5_SODAK|nr:hypothetical protein SODALDRAFT_46985 [Sodiomyces alkalinus F11]ROT43760.1 hypothetical protein SODALDRAFT_46985 [Sodiomyces alkalinus F11]